MKIISPLQTGHNWLFWTATS